MKITKIRLGLFGLVLFSLFACTPLGEEQAPSPGDTIYPEPEFYSQESTPDMALANFPTAENTGIRGAGLTPNDMYKTRSLHIGPGRIRMGSDDGLVDIESDHELFQSGYIVQTAEGYSLQKLHVVGGIYIYDGADNTLIENSMIELGMYGIKCFPDTENTIIRNCTLFNDVQYRSFTDQGQTFQAAHRNNEFGGKAILGNNCKIISCDISGYADGIYLSNNVEILDNYIHDLYFYNPQWDDPQSIEDMTHSDGIQSSGGGGFLIRHNRIDSRGFSNSAIILQNRYGNTHHVLIDNNYMLGGSYTLYVRDRQDAVEDYSVREVIIRNNIFFHSDPRHHLAIDQNIEAEIHGNISEEGTILDMNNS